MTDKFAMKYWTFREFTQINTFNIKLTSLKAKTRIYWLADDIIAGGSHIVNLIFNDGSHLQHMDQVRGGTQLF